VGSASPQKRDHSPVSALPTRAELKTIQIPVADTSDRITAAMLSARIDAKSGQYGILEYMDGILQNTHGIDDNCPLIGADLPSAKHGSTGSAASYV